MKKVKKGYKGYICTIRLLILCAIINVTPLSYALNITPGRGEFVIETDKEYRGEFNLTNTEDTPLKLGIFVEELVIQKGKDATDWIKVWPNELEIPANGSKKIGYIIKAPKGVEGEYTSSIVFRTLTPAKKGVSLDAVSQVRMMVYVAIKGTEIIKGEISKVEVLENNPLKISIKVKNLGNIHIRPEGSVEVTRIEKNDTGFNEITVALLSLNPIEGPIFTDSEGDIGPKSDDIKLEPGNYIAKVRVELASEVILNKEIEFTVPEKSEAKKE